MPDPSSLVSVATADNWARVIGNRTLRQRIFMEKMRRAGCFTKGHTGKNLGWKERIADIPLGPRGAGTELNYTQYELLAQYQTDIRGYYMGLKLGEKERVTNSGPEALFVYMDELQPIAEESAAKALNKELLTRDGSAANSDYFEALGTVLKFTTPTYASDRIATPSVTDYAGVDLRLGQEPGSSWSDDMAAADQPNQTLSKDWPLGNGTSPYDCRSPLGLVADATSHGTDSREFGDNCDVLFTIGADWQRSRRGGKTYGPEIWLVGVEWWGDYKQFQKARFRNLVPHPESRDLGFAGEMLIQDEIPIACEYEMPARRALGINFKAYEVCLWKNPYRASKNALFYSTGWMDDPKTGDMILRLAMWGNTKIWPGGLVDIREYSATG